MIYVGFICFLSQQLSSLVMLPFFSSSLLQNNKLLSFLCSNYTFQCIQHRALNPDDPSLPDLDPVIARYLMVLLYPLKSLTLFTLMSVCIFSILFSIHFRRCWQGEFTQQLKVPFIGDHFLYSQGLNAWFSCDIVRRDQMPTVTVGGCMYKLNNLSFQKDAWTYILFNQGAF